MLYYNVYTENIKYRNSYFVTIDTSYLIFKIDFDIWIAAHDYL